MPDLFLKDFSDLLIAYAGFPPKKKTRMLKRVKKAFGKQQDLKGISLDDFLSFYQVGCFAELGLGKWSTRETALSCALDLE